MSEVAEEQTTTEEPVLVDTIPSMSKEAKATFVKEYLQNLIYTDWNMPPHSRDMVHMVFMPLALGALRNHTEEAINDVGLVWEYMSRAESRSINGMPIFFSMRLMNQADAAQCFSAIKKRLEMMEKMDNELMDSWLDPDINKPLSASPGDEGSAEDESSADLAGEAEPLPETLPES